MNNIKMFEFYDKKKDYNINVFSYIPKGNFDEMKVIMVMSGCLRDALNYLKNWIDSAEVNKYIIIAPEFDKGHYTIADHEYGNIIDIDYDYSSQDIYTPYMKYGCDIKSNTEWIFQLIDKIYLKFIKLNNIENNGYIIFGHSSGAQFVHRFLMLSDSVFCKKYIIANAGLYTFYDEESNYPYGIKNLTKYNDIIKKSLEKEVCILLGEDDIKKDYLNCMTLDMQEGKNRLERGNNYFQSALEYACKENISFNWKKVIMKKVGHDNKNVIPYAEEFINNED